MRIFKTIFLCLYFILAGLDVVAETTMMEIAGHVRSSKNKKPLENVAISICESPIGTVTNSDGYFSLKVPSDYPVKSIKLDLLGFEAITFPIPKDEDSQKNLTVMLNPSGKVLNEILVLGGNPKEIVKIAFHKIADNYSNEDNLFQGFYRETIQKGNRYLSISEAMVDLLKKPYTHRNIRGEKVSIHRGRRLLSPKNSDTLSVKLMDGPFLPINFDAVKNEDHLFTKDEIENFTYTMLPSVIIDNHPHYSIQFTPNVELPYLLHNGIFYIDTESYTISRVEFSLDMKDKAKVTRSILHKKPTGLRFKPLEVSGVVTYKSIEGKSYINYIATKIRFQCDWKKRLFYSTYTSTAEMVMVNRDNSPEKKLKFAETFGKKKIFSDLVDNYWEPDFWKDYNIIEPSESLENAVKKLRKN